MLFTFSRFPLHVPVNSQVIYLTSLNIPGGQEGQGPLGIVYIYIYSRLNANNNNKAWRARVILQT